MKGITRQPGVMMNKQIQLPTQTAHIHALLTTQQAANLLGVSKSFLDKARVKGSGPPFHRIGSVVRYNPADVHEWADGFRYTSTSCADAGEKVKRTLH
jgi:excisionase family DNA binding protein